MTTPSRESSGTGLRNPVPSGSFLQQLLEEINGSDTPTVLRNRVTPQGTPPSRHSANGSRRASSVWVGGTAIAQDAREKLRAADEARMRKTLVGGSTHGTPGAPRQTLHLQTECFDYPSSTSSTSTTGLSPRNPCLPSPVGDGFTAHGTRSTMSNAVESSRCRSVVGGLCLPGPKSHTMQTLANDIAEQNSPLFFCDIDSDISATPSPTEPPTSAISAALTDATTMSEERSAIPTVSESHSPGKRLLSQNESLETLFKRTRKMTLPVAQGPPIAHAESRSSSLSGSMGGDNRCVIRSSTFTERAPAPMHPIDSVATSILPELSSFRPSTADPQGVPPISAIPVRPPTPRSSTIEQDESIEPADTPIYARSLHLVDTEVSIYKKTHGNEWRINSLCLHCFRQRGAFNCLNKHGYEVCGRIEALDSHYWESNGDFEDD